MHLVHLRLRDFRNYARLDIDFAPGFHLFLGGNAQGKTNLLEAIYFLATLRSFRGVSSAHLVRAGQKGYYLGATVLGQAEQSIRIYWSANERQLSLDGRPIRRLSEFLGVCRAVVFCTDDVQLVKGPASRRRRFLDLLLSQTHPTYLPLLQRYTRSLCSRNALLKERTQNEAALESFARELIDLGSQIVQLRRQLMPRFSPLATGAYQRMAGGADQLRLAYLPSVKEDFAVELSQSHARERVLRATLVGPHRDDLQLLMDERPAIHFASEGQKRSVAIALKIAQAEYLAQVHGTRPILLIDDIMGELDVRRRGAFLPLLQKIQPAQGQVFMTCTEENWPAELGGNLKRWEIRNGTVQAMAAGAQVSNLR